MKQMIRICILVMMLSIQTLTVCAAPNALQDYILVLQNDNFKLYYNETTAEVALEDQETSKIWFSNPQNIEENPTIINFNKMKLQSQLLIEVVNENNIPEASSSFLESVKKETFDYVVEDNKLIVTYTFNKFSIQIPLIYELTDNGLKTSIDSNSITEGESHRLTKVAMVPYFGAAAQGTEGYILLPDGPGAIMEFDKYSNSNVYGSKVYGRDLSLTNDTAPNKDERIMLPVFGMKLEDEGVFAIITDGEPYASIVAQQALPIIGYNYAYADFEVRVRNHYYLEEKDPGRNRKVPYISESIKKDEIYAVEYNILEEGKSDYVSMAAFYQDYLVEQGLLPELKNTTSQLIHLDIYGGVNVDGVILGIPVTEFLSLTTFEQCQLIVEALVDQGVDEMSVRYRGWEEDGLIREGAQNKTVVASDLGGEKGMEALQTALADQGVNIFFEHDLINYKPRNLSFTDLQKTIKNVGNYYAYQYNYNLPTKDIDTTVDRTLLISPAELEKRVPKMIDDLGEYVSIKNMADVVYHDSHKEGGSITNTIDTFTEQLAVISEGRQVLVDSPNMYGLKYVDSIVDVPVYSSDYMNFTRDVPFYQLVLQGYFDYFTPYINRNPNPQEMLLKAIESGSGISFGGTYEDPTVLIDTPYNGLMVSEYNTWQGMAVDMYNELAEIEALTEGSLISNHEVVETNVIKVTYANGVEIIINYNKETVQYDGQVIPAKEYTILNP